MALPAGFTLEQPSSEGVSLPAGFQLEQPASRAKYALSEVPGAALKNAPASAGRFATGMLEMVTSPLQTLTGILDIGAGALRSALPSQVVNFVDQFDADPAAAKRASAAAKAAGGMYADRYGDYESIKRTFAEDPVGAVGDLSTLLGGGGAAARVVGATATGNALAKASTLTNVALPFAKAIEVPVQLAAKGVGAVRNALDPKSAAYITAAEGRGGEILNALRNPTQLVPGSMPTAAQAAAPVGATRFSVLGASSAKTLPTPYFERGEAQKAAQLAAVQQVGRTPEELRVAEAARAATAKELYGVSDEATLPGRERQFRPVQVGTTPKGAPLKEVESGVPQMVEAGVDPLTNQPIMKPVSSVGGQPIYEHVVAGYKYDPELVKLMERPAVKAAFDDAATIAANNGVPMFTSEGKLTGKGAHLVKLALDDAANPTPGTPLAANAANAIQTAKKGYLAWVEDKVPAYRTARETFAAESKPINQMQVGQYLEGKLTPALGEETARLRSAGYAAALKEAPGTIKRATGQSRFDQLSDILDPDQIKILEGVRNDLARNKLMEAQASAARGAGPDVNLLGSAVMSEARVPNFMNTVATVANDIMRRLQGKLDQKLAIELATEMLDPAAAATALEKALARQAQGQKLSDPFKAAGKAASAVIRTPAAVNVLSQQEPTNRLILE